MAIALGIELPYAVLIAAAYLRMLGLHRSAELGLAIALTAAAQAAKTALVATSLRRRLRPVERWLAASGPAPAALVARAGKAAYETPFRVALLWASAWAFAYAPVVGLLVLRPDHPLPLEPRTLLSVALGSLALFTAALPAGYAILAWLLLDTTGRISLVARAEGIDVPARSLSLRARLAVVTTCLAVAPTSWMASLFVCPLAGPGAPGAWLTLALFALVAVAWVPVSAGFLAALIASPFRGVGTAIRHLVEHGDTGRIERLPVHFKDEIGALSEGVNAMVDRLEESSARLRSYLAERAEVARMKDQFIKVAAHELKTPVAIMKGYSLTLLRSAEELSPRARSMLGAVDRGADRMSRIVDDILAVSQAGLDAPRLSSERLDLVRVVEDAIAGMPEPARRRIRIEGLAGHGPVLARGDAERVRWVVTALLDNGVKYSPKGGCVDVAIEAVAPAKEGNGEARVAVRDRGVGIPAGKQSRIFEPLFRAHTDTAYDCGGLGVGLYLAKEIVARQGGRMWFESEEQVGTAFHFALPLERASARPEGGAER